MLFIFIAIAVFMIVYSNIKMDGCTFTNLDISNDLGDIVVSSCGDLSGYAIDASVSLG